MDDLLQHNLRVMCRNLGAALTLMSAGHSREVAGIFVPGLRGLSGAVGLQVDRVLVSERLVQDETDPNWIPHAPA